MSSNFILRSCKTELLDIYKTAIKAVCPQRLVENSVCVKNNVLLVKDYTNGIQDYKLDLHNRNVHVIGGGKSVLSMANGLANVVAEANLRHLFSKGLLSVPVGLRDSLDQDSKLKLELIGVTCLFGSANNLPDESSVIASEQILEGIKLACEVDRSINKKPLFIVLISGGGSACLASPRAISLEGKLHLIKLLVQRGANIIELNKVRSYFSNIKGGRLAAHIISQHPEAQILSLILSDVIGDPIEYIASGPTFPSQDSQESALDILEKYDCVGANRFTVGMDPIGPGRVRFNGDQIRNHIIGNNKIALEAAIARAQNLGYIVRNISNVLEGSSKEVVDKICAEGEQLVFNKTCGKYLIIGGGESTIVKEVGETWGKGGRVQEMALDYIMSKMKNSKLHLATDRTDVFLAGTSDGQDGPTDVAACIISQQDFEADEFKYDEAKKAKSSHNSYNFWSKNKNDCLIRTGLTGTNVMDLYMYLIAIN